MRHDVAVLGSLNLDCVFICEERPAPGETVLCDNVEKGPGGKGLNQAIASGRAGASTILYGGVGADSDGKILLRALESSGVALTGIRQLDSVCTGLAHIVVDHGGENAIVVASGANKSDELGPELFEDARATVFLAQLEMDIPLVHAFFEKGRSRGSLCVLNAAPAFEEAQTLLSLCDFLILNEHELALLCRPDSISAEHGEITEAARGLLRSDTQSVLVTLGAAGVLWVTAEQATHFEARKAQPVDTTGAGDCFCGVFAASIAQGKTTHQAIERAIAAAAIAVTRKGAAQALPVASEYDF